MDKCPHCGSIIGVYTTFTGTQYYVFNGDPAGCSLNGIENQRAFARCIKCDRKISMNRILKEAELAKG